MEISGFPAPDPGSPHCHFPRSWSKATRSSTHAAARQGQGISRAASLVDGAALEIRSCVMAVVRSPDPRNLSRRRWSRPQPSRSRPRAKVSSRSPARPPASSPTSAPATACSSSTSATPRVAHDPGECRSGCAHRSRHRAAAARAERRLMGSRYRRAGRHAGACEGRMLRRQWAARAGDRRRDRARHLARHLRGRAPRAPASARGDHAVRRFAEITAALGINATRSAAA